VRGAAPEQIRPPEPKRSSLDTGDAIIALGLFPDPLVGDSERGSDREFQMEPGFFSFDRAGEEILYGCTEPRRRAGEFYGFHQEIPRIWSSFGGRCSCSF
jgi:hypothetical protein